MITAFKQITLKSTGYAAILFMHLLFLLVFPSASADVKTTGLDGMKLDCASKVLKKIFEVEPTVMRSFLSKNLNSTKASALKIPKTIHHIWLTSSTAPKEIDRADIDAIIHNQKIHAGDEWTHIVWTNDKNLIPKTVAQLETNKIQVREISEIENQLRLKKLIKILIEKKLWGMASDVLRYELLNYMGGIYTDVDFVFHRSIAEELYIYDFLIKTVFSRGKVLIDNYFICAAANHPILNKTLELIAYCCDEKFIAFLDLSKPEDLANIIINMTDALTLIPFMTAYFLYVLQPHATIDAVYPLYDPANTHNEDGDYTTWMQRYDIGDERVSTTLSWIDR